MLEQQPGTAKLPKKGLLPFCFCPRRCWGELGTPSSCPVAAGGVKGRMCGGLCQDPSFWVFGHHPGFGQAPLVLGLGRDLATERGV